MPECTARVDDNGTGLWVDRANAVLTQEAMNAHRWAYTPSGQISLMHIKETVSAHLGPDVCRVMLWGHAWPRGFHVLRKAHSRMQPAKHRQIILRPVITTLFCMRSPIEGYGMRTGIRLVRDILTDILTSESKNFGSATSVSAARSVTSGHQASARRRRKVPGVPRYEPTGPRLRRPS
jgi:hypothetical protein